NNPGARYSSVSWSDGSNNIWLFGGVTGTNFFNDLWKYTPSINQWTWVAGNNTANQKGSYGTSGTGSVSNIPGARSESISWVDGSGNFWLFGGRGYGKNGSPGYLNDLWRFNPVNNQWTWIEGSNTKNNVGIYGTQGIGSSSN